MQRSIWLAILIVAMGTALAQEARREVPLRTTIARPCISLTNENGTSVILSKKLLLDLSAKRPSAASLLPRSADSGRAEHLLQLAQGPHDRFGCASTTFPTGDDVYLVAGLIKSGRAAVITAGSELPEKSVYYLEGTCDDRNPAGFISVRLKDGSLLIPMLLACIT